MAFLCGVALASSLQNLLPRNDGKRAWNCSNAVIVRFCESRIVAIYHRIVIARQVVGLAWQSSLFSVIAKHFEKILWQSIKKILESFNFAESLEYFVDSIKSTYDSMFL